MAAPPHPRLQNSSLSNSSALRETFQQLGWCSHQFRRLQQTCTSEALHYLSTLDRRGYRPNNHGVCIDKSCCVANNVNTQSYEAAHTQTCPGSCLPVAVDYDDVVNIIRAGGIPIVSIHVDAASSTVDEPLLCLKVTPRAISTRYTVISHVWFDGLGNPSANALPTCQVRRLFAQLQSLPRDHESNVLSIGSLQVDWSRQSFVRYPKRQPPLFWMDTLCIPVGDEHKDLRKRAINQMASIYAAAVQELVLDAELMQCEAGTGAALETLARLTCSAWMTRSWTLQEGVLARECVFQFKDCAIDPIHEWCLHGARPMKNSKALDVRFPLPTDQEHWAVYKELYNVLWDTLHQDWKSRYRKDPPTAAAYRASGGALFGVGSFRGSQATGKIHTLPVVEGLSKRSRNGLDEKDHFTMHLREEHRMKQLVDTWNELMHRSTTMPEDLHVIIANLLDFNADRIMVLPTREERMRAMVLSFELLPASLFWNTGPKWYDDTSPNVDGNNNWIPIEPSKCELSLTPTMKVSDEWLILDLDTPAIEQVPSARVFLLHRNGIDIYKQSSFLCSGLSELLHEVTMLDARCGEKSMPVEAPHYLIVETFPQSPTTELTRGAMFHRLLSQPPNETGEVQLSYCCPVTLHALKRPSNRDSQHAIAEALSRSTKVAIKYTPIPNFTQHPRRLNRGPTFQGGVVVVLLLPIPAVIGVGCILAFIILISRPPHTFTPTAQGLLAAFFILYLGCSLLGGAWLFFIEALMYRMWLASFESEWVEGKGVGKEWWGRYIAFEKRLARVEHGVYTRIMRVIEALSRAFVKRSRSDGRIDGRGEDGLAGA